jgi:hypothetical protein
VSSGSVIQIVFVDLEMEGHGSCNYDYIEVSNPSMFAYLEQ